MAESKPAQAAPKIEYVDVPGISETYADTVRGMMFDGQSVRLELCVTRMNEPANGSRRAHRQAPDRGARGAAVERGARALDQARPHDEHAGQARRRAQGKAGASEGAGSRQALVTRVGRVTRALSFRPPEFPGAVSASRAATWRRGPRGGGDRREGECACASARCVPGIRLLGYEPPAQCPPIAWRGHRPRARGRGRRGGAAARRVRARRGARASRLGRGHASSRTCSRRRSSSSIASSSIARSGADVGFDPEFPAAPEALAAASAAQRAVPDRARCGRPRDFSHALAEAAVPDAPLVADLGRARRHRYRRGQARRRRATCRWRDRARARGTRW